MRTPRTLRPLAALLVTAVMLALLAFASDAHAAAGLFLRWDRCEGDGGVLNKTFACDTNAGGEKLVGGFELGVNFNLLIGNVAVIDLASAGPVLPAWWTMREPGTCRFTSMAMNTAIDPSAIACVDWAQAVSAGGIPSPYQIGIRGPNTARFLIVLAIPDYLAQKLVVGQKYFSFNVTINHAKTVGTGACGGCLTPVCIVMGSMELEASLGPSVKLSGPANGTDSDYVTWQGGGGVVIGGVSGCPAATPTRRSSWGAVRALYR